MKNKKNSSMTIVHTPAGLEASNRVLDKPAIKDRIKKTRLRPSNDTFKVEKWHSADKASPIHWKLINTLVGEILIASTMKGICFIGFGDHKRDTSLAELQKRFPENTLIEQGDNFQKEAVAHINNPNQKSLVHLHLKGSEFQVAIWKKILRIPYGGLVTYGALGKSIQEARAVGTAVGANPVCLIVGCHRVVHADGNIEGFHYGSDLKRKLLVFEARRLSNGDPNEDPKRITV